MNSETAASSSCGHERPRYAKAQPYSRRAAIFPFFRALFAALTLGLSCAAATAVAEPLRVVAFGDSLSAGFQLPSAAAFPNVLEARLKRDGYDAHVVNAAVSGDTTQGGVSRLPYALRDGADLLILELGANDMLRGTDPKITRDNLAKMISYCESKRVKVLLAGMIATANFGGDGKKAFDAIYPELARSKSVPLYPFFLDGLFDDQSLLLSDGLHPSAAGVERIVSGIAPLVEAALDVVRTDRKGAAAR